MWTAKWDPYLTWQNRLDVTKQEVWVTARPIYSEPLGVSRLIIQGMSVRKIYKVTANFTAPMDLRKFPYDKQRLPIRLSMNAITDRRATRVYLKKAKFHVGSAFLPRNEYMPYPAIFYHLNETDTSKSRTGFAYPQFTMVMSVSRIATSYTWEMIFPLWLITSGSCFSFVADDPVAVTATMIISAMAFQTYAKSELPKVIYMYKDTYNGL